MFLEERRDAHSVPGKAQRAGATPRRRRCRRLPVRNAGRGGTARGWEDGLNGVGAPRGEGDAGSQSRAGVRRRPRVKKPGRHRAREESYCVVRSRRLRNPRAGGVGAGAAWRPRATRARPRRIRRTKLAAPSAGQGSGRDRGLRGGCNKSEASGFFWLCYLRGPTPMMPFWRGCGRGSVGKTPNVCAMSPGHEHSQPPWVR